MMRKERMVIKYAIAAASILIPVLAFAAPPFVNPVVIALPLGSTAHLTPRDQNGAAIPIDQCTLAVTNPLPVVVASAVKDATGYVLTSVASGSASGRWTCTDGVTSVLSASFTVTVPNPPYAVTAVGHTMP